MARVTMVSPILERELTAAGRQAWPALAPKFPFASGAQVFAPAAATYLAADKRAAARQGQEGLQALATLRASAALPAWQLELASVAALLKLARVDEALALLDTLQHNEGLAVSVNAPAHRPAATLMGAHWLWLVAHVAVEHDVAERVLPRLWALGLQARAACEPHLAAGLLVNALRQPALGALQQLVALRLRLPAAQAQAFVDYAAAEAGAAQRQGVASAVDATALRRLGTALGLLELEVPCRAALLAATPGPRPHRLAGVWARLQPRATQSVGLQVPGRTTLR